MDLSLAFFVLEKMGDNVKSAHRGHDPNPADVNSICNTKVDENSVEGREKLSNEMMDLWQMRLEHMIERHPDGYKKNYVDCDCPVCTEGWKRLSIEKMDLRQTREDHIIENHPDMYKKCPSCGSILKRPVDDPDQPCQSVRCSQCAPPQHFCWSCLGPWVFSNKASARSCSNKSCGLVATLLNCDMVVDNRSAVFGCPLFRACPKCRGLIMHIEGCKNVTCSNCKHLFCFVCLEAIFTCNACTYGICKKGRAGRQRFVT